MKVLVVVDMQTDFIDGALGTAEARAIVPAVAEKIRAFDGQVVATLDTHAANYLSSQEGRLLPVVHCVDGTPGWALNEAIQAAMDTRAETVRLFRKPTFGSVELAEYLTALNDRDKLEEIELVGLCTDICVISNALLLKAYLPDVPMTVDAACCAGVTPESHQNALAAMEMCQVRVVNS